MAQARYSTNSRTRSDNQARRGTTSRSTGTRSRSVRASTARGRTTRGNRSAGRTGTARRTSVRGNRSVSSSGRRGTASRGSRGSPGVRGSRGSRASVGTGVMRGGRSGRTSPTSRGSRTSLHGVGVVREILQDHRKVQALLGRLEETESDDERLRLFEQCVAELQVHATLEEELFYPAFKEAVGDDEEDRSLFFEAAEEHHAVDRLIEEMQQGDHTSEKFCAQCTLLKELVKHHIEEEQEEMLPIARREIGKERLSEIGQRWIARKRELAQEFDLKEAGTYEGSPNPDQQKARLREESYETVTSEGRSGNASSGSGGQGGQKGKGIRGMFGRSRKDERSDAWSSNIESGQTI